MTTSMEGGWTALRAELATTSAPVLPHPARSACWALAGLTLLGGLLHLVGLVASWHSGRTQLCFFNFNSLGYRRPVLATILPVIFFIHALLNLAAIIGLLTDLSSSRFRGRTNAIQQASFSLLICAGLFKTWDLLSRLPSLSPAFTPSRALLRTNHPPPRLCHLFTFSSLMLVVLLPVPCIVLTSTAIDTLDTLTPALVTTIDTILANATVAAVDLAAQQIEGLEAAASTLAVHTRMLAGFHLLFTAITLAGFLITSFALTRHLRAQVMVFCDSLEYRYELAAAKAKAAGVAYLPPARRPIRVHDAEPTANRGLCGGGKLAAFALKYADLQAETSRIYLEAGLLTIIATSFLALNLCIVTDAFKYPTRTSLGTILLIAIQWASWSWAGIPGPVFAIASCAQIFKPRTPPAEKHVAKQHVVLDSLHGVPSSGDLEQDWHPKVVI